MKAAIYTRVSTREQAIEGYSLEAQRNVLIDYCKSKNLDIYGIYSDEGISAKDIHHRPGLLALLADAYSLCFDVIVIWKLTRFSRNTADLAATCERLDKLGIALISYTEAFDSTTPSGRMIRTILGSVAQFEREVTGENCSLAMATRAKQGKRTCSSVLGYNPYGSDSFTINKSEAIYVNFVHDQFLACQNLSKVAELAYKKGFRGKRGQAPTPWSIYKILTCPVYAGWNRFHGCVYKGDYESIRTVQQYNQVQNLLLGQKKNRDLIILPEE